MKKENPLFTFWKTSSSLFPGVKRDLTGSAADKSMYNIGGKKTTVLFPLLKALAISSGETSDDFFIGKTKDDNFVAELASVSRPDWITVAFYNPVEGDLKAITVNKVTNELRRYHVSTNDATSGTLSDDDFHVSDGTVLWLALLPTILENEEALKAAEIILKEYKDPLRTLTSSEELNKAAGKFSDNVYIRICGGLEAAPDKDVADAHIILHDEDQPRRLLVNQLSNKMAYTEVLYGNPIIVKKSRTKKTKKVKEGEFNIGMKLSEEQKAMIPVMPKGYVTTHTTIKMCETVRRTRGSDFPVKDFLLEGPAGTGKTSSAEDFAYQLGVPFRCFTCSSGTTEDQIFGGIYPNPSSLSNGNKDAINDIPTALEIECDPVESYKKITGEHNPKVTVEEVFAAANAKLRQLLKEGTANSSGISYDYYPSTIVEILKNGGVIEIQEPGAIASASTLSCLNDILSKSDGIISTPYGPIKRHPDCFIIATNNPDSNVGYGKLNEAVRNRFDRTYIIDLPTVDELVERAMQKGLIKDKIKCRAMAEAIRDIDVCIRENGIQGEAGQRCFFAWCQDVEAGVDMSEAVADCVVNNITSNKDEQEIIYDVLKTNTTLL